MRSGIARAWGIGAVLLAVAALCPAVRGDDTEATGSGAWIGVSTRAATSNWPGISHYSGSGLKVVDVTPGGPADQAGIEQGDILVKIDSRPLKRPEDLAAALRAIQPGHPVEVVLAKAGGRSIMTFSMRAGPLPWVGAGAIAPAAGGTTSDNGVAAGVGVAAGTGAAADTVTAGVAAAGGVGAASGAGVAAATSSAATVGTAAATDKSTAAANAAAAGGGGAVGIGAPAAAGAAAGVVATGIGVAPGTSSSTATAGPPADADAQAGAVAGPASAGATAVTGAEAGTGAAAGTAAGTAASAGTGAAVGAAALIGGAVGIAAASGSGASADGAEPTSPGQPGATTTEPVPVPPAAATASSPSGTLPDTSSAAAGDVRGKGAAGLGVRCENLSLDLAAALGSKAAQGVLVLAVNSASPADRAGIRPGDLISRVGGQPVVDVDGMDRILATATSPLPIVTVRRGATREVSAEFPSPAAPSAAEHQSTDQILTALRDEVRNLRDEVRKLREELTSRAGGTSAPHP